MLSPREYLSYSQLILFEKSPEEYRDVYFRGKKKPTSRYMAFGSKMADGLETGEATGDPVLDAMMSRIPKFELMDKEVRAEMKDGKEKIILLAKPDTSKKDYSAFKEYKTSTMKWTQKMADESDQITFYAAVMWLLTGKIPKDIELVAIGTEIAPDGSVVANGDMDIFRTKIVS